MYVSSPSDLVQAIHNCPTRIALAITGGGSRAIAELAEVPGASRTLLEAVVPYAAEALAAWLGFSPEQSCSPRTARAMAMAAYQRAGQLVGQAADLSDQTPLAGIACTASLASDRPKRGPHRAHVAMQTAAATVSDSLELCKGRRSRAEEERLVSRLVLNLIAEACDLDERLTLDLVEGEEVQTTRTVAPQAWRDLLAGKIDVLGWDPAGTTAAGGAAGRAIFPGAFNPLHAAHRRMAQVAGEILATPVEFEISMSNVDKPLLDFTELASHVAQFEPGSRMWLTRAARFEEKARVFPGATFVVGADTMARIAEARYYGGDRSACEAAIARIAEHGCRFLVFGRLAGGGFKSLDALDLPKSLRRLAREVPAAAFREDISSTEMRRRAGEGSHHGGTEDTEEGEEARKREKEG
ncbi:MAG: CinA family protein [Pirellulales bacterium]